MGWTPNPSSGGGSYTPLLGYTPGQWYLTHPFVRTATGTNGPGATTTYLLPFILEDTLLLAQLGCGFTTAGGNIQLAVYASDADEKPTGNPEAVTANIDVSGTPGNVFGDVIGADVSLARGVHWLGLQSDNTAVRFTTISPDVSIMGGIRGAATQAALRTSATNLANTLSVTGGVFGTWPDLTSATLVEDTAYRLPIGHMLAA